MSGRSNPTRAALVSELPGLLDATGRTTREIALTIGVTPRCIDGIRAGEHAASAHVLLALGKHYPSIRALVVRLLDTEV